MINQHVPWTTISGSDEMRTNMAAQAVTGLFTHA